MLFSSIKVLISLAQLERFNLFEFDLKYVFVKSSLPMLEISEFPIEITEKSRFNSLALEIISNVPELNSLLFTSPIIKVYILL